MTDPTGSTPPFPGFPGFPPAEMLDRMWDMMRLTPFGQAFPGATPGAGQGFAPSLSMMSDMMAPLTNVEELDKRITDMRAVEQWLKLNLSMLQSAIQALEVQRATLATLRAFGAFAQAPMGTPSSGASTSAFPFGSGSLSGSGSSAGASGSSYSTSSGSSAFSTPPRGDTSASSADASDAAAKDPGAEDATSATGFDPGPWWNLLQSQFNQLASFALAQQGAMANAATEGVQAAAAAANEHVKTAATAATAAPKAAAKRAASATPKRSGATKSTGTRTPKKSPPPAG